MQHSRATKTFNSASRAFLIAFFLLVSDAFAQTQTSSAGSNVSILAAFLAGLISFLSPCVLPLVPSYLAVLGGATGKKPVQGALLFILGFSLVFISLGAGASALGSVLRENKNLLGQIGGALILVFGIVLLIKDRVPFLAREYRSDLNSASQFGLVALGAAFAAGWTPCLGPILGLILTVAASSAEVGRGVGLLTMYSLGLAVPFLLAALAWRQVSSVMRKVGRYVNIIEKISGVLLIVAGVLLVTGTYSSLGNYLQGLTPEWLKNFENGLKN
jgi:cytochrome c-type biogenesis protein